VLDPPPEPLQPHVQGPVPENEATEPAAQRLALLDERDVYDLPEAVPQDPFTADVVDVTVSVFEPVLLLLSVAVNVIALLPLATPIDDTLHELVPVAVPLAGVQVGHAHFRVDIGALPDAVPYSETDVSVVE